jgi:ADP-heptose:LPS heptosyltransferase/thioredoxin-like negative regulator of GroEL
MTAAALLARATQARETGRLQDAAGFCLEALRQDAANPVACRLLGEIALHSGQHALAVDMLGTATRLVPNDVGTIVNLGAAYQAMDHFEEAASCYRRALTIAPSLTQARSNLAAVLMDMGDEDGAEREYRAVLAQAPDFADTHVNYGNLVRRRGELTAAITHYRRGIAHAPMHPMAHTNLGGALLMLEHWSEGWSEFEWRWRLGDNPALRTRHRLPLWQGDDLNGRRILLWGEQGIGDVVLFASMLPDLLATGAQVSLEIEPRLIPLFRRSFPQIQLFAWDTVPADAAFDVQANIGRLGLFLRTSADRFAGAKPYLVPDPARVADFKARYAALGTGPRIGISWRSASQAYRRKSLQLEDFAPLFAAFPGATFVSLQYGDTADDIARAEQICATRIHRDSSFDNWTDLDGLVAQIAALDTVVTVSNLNAHLAGATGIPTNVLVTQNTLWYWPHEKPNSAWYPSLRLYGVASGHAAAIAAVAAQFGSGPPLRQR